MKNDSFSINLIKRNKSFFDEFIRWTFTIGRLIIILTEAVALSAFLYRFSLDRELIDLHDSIRNKQIIVENLKNNEEKYRNLQERLALVSTVEKNKNLTIIEDIVSFAGSEVRINDILVSETSVKLNATGQSVVSLSSFVNSLKDYKEIRSISIDKIENRPSLGIITISISAELAQKAQSLFQTNTE